MNVDEKYLKRMIKHAGVDLDKEITILLQKIFQTATVPAEWRKSINDSYIQKRNKIRSNQLQRLCSTAKLLTKISS